MASYTVSLSNDSIEIPVNVTVLGSLSHHATVILQHSENEYTFSVGRSSGIQNLQIPSRIDMNNKIITITVRLTTKDPLVELKGNVTTSVSIVASNGLLYS